MSTAAELRVELQRLQSEETRLRAEYDAFGTQISSLIDQLRPLDREIANQKSIITDPNATPAQKDAATVRGRELENQYNNINRQINQIRDQQTNFLNNQLRPVQNKINNPIDGIKTRIQTAERKEKEEADEAQVKKNEEDRLAAEKEQADIEASARARAAGQPVPEDTETVGDPTPANEAQTAKEVEGQGGESTDPGEIPGITTQSAFAEQTDPGENPYTVASQTDPGESPDTATDRLANVDENQSAAETARLNRQAVDAKTPEVPQIDLVNPLHKYDSYTYSLSLYMMDFTKDYESLTSAPNQFQAPADKCLIASAGRGKRAAAFNTEFYFEDLEFTTVLGITPQNRNSNLISGSFKIIEPLGFTLINRLVDATKAIVDPSKSPRYEQQPYLLKIEFFGIEEGKMKPTPVEGDGPSGKFTTTKHIPIRIINMSAEVTERGSEYKIDFVPFHHQALMAQSVSIQTKFQLSGATIEEILGANDFDNKPFTISGAINKYYNDLAKKTNASAVANKIKFEIDPTIAKAKIYELQKGSSNNIDINYKSDGGVWWVEPNQQLDRLIDFFIRNSAFFTSQIGDTKRADESLKYYKVLPKVKQIGFDETANSNVFETTYVITPYSVTSKQPGAIKPKVEGQVKKYNYMFTGKNIDILDFKIEYKMLYFQTYSAFQNKNASSQGDASISPDEAKRRENKTINEQPARKMPNDPTYASQHQAIAGSGGQSGIAGQRSEKSELANHVVLDLLNTPSGDMVNLDLRIIGDPLFIKQDDLFYAPSATGTQDLLTQNGSFIMDRGELYVMIEFNSPQDYNESTGLTDFKK